MQCHLLTEVAVKVEDELGMLAQLSSSQSHFLSGWVVDKTKKMQCHLLTEVLDKVEDEVGKIGRFWWCNLQRFGLQDVELNIVFGALSDCQLK